MIYPPRHERLLVYTKILVIFVSLVVVRPTPAASQSVDAVVKGRVSDQSGAALPGVSVVITNESNGVERSTTTAADGHYVLLDLQNLTNETNDGDFIGTVTSNLFGQPTTAGPMRRTQLGLRIDS